MTMFTMAALLMVGCAAVGAVVLVTATGARPSTVDRLRAYQPLPALPEDDAERTSKVLHRVDTALAGTNLAQRIHAQLQGAAVGMTVAEAIAIEVVSIVGLTVLGFLLAGPFAMVLGLGVGAFAPWMVLRTKESRRQRAFDQALPDALTGIANVLSAGHALPFAIQEAAKYTSGPMADEFNRVVLETRLSRTVEDSLDAVAKRMDNADLASTVMAMRIAVETGGNLADVLKGVAATIRERERLRRHTRTLSAEGRLSAVILGGLPVLVFVAVKFINPKYIETLTSTGLGIMLLIGGALLLTVGALWMRALVKGVTA